MARARSRPTSSGVTLTFYLPGEPDLEALARVDPERAPAEFQRGERVWILQTYLNLKAAGRPVSLSATVPSRGPVVFHATHKGLLRRDLPRRYGLLAGVRGDRSEPLLADAEVVQNGCFADGDTRFFLPHWPQPGLVPRDPARGARVDRAVFKGNLESLDPSFLSPDWKGFLEGEGIAWEVHAVDYRHLARGEASVDWSDYSATDLLIGIRSPDPRLHRSKPASKLVNAWRAGVPAILGPEAAFRELRRSELDYCECSGVEDARACVLRLKGDAGLYRAMVENGLRRAEEFTREAVTARWGEFLYEKLVAVDRLPRVRFLRRLPPRLKITAKWCLRALALRPAR